MERKGVDILCMQETGWKREKAKCVGGGYKTWYCGSGNKKNGVGIILKKEQVDMVVELWRVTDRIICLKMELDGVILSVRMYLDETVEKIPKNERIVVGADLNEQVGEGNNSDQECIGRHRLGKRNNEGQAVMYFA